MLCAAYGVLCSSAAGQAAKPFASNDSLRAVRTIAAPPEVAIVDSAMRSGARLPVARNAAPVALEGYCPVSLKDRQQWIEGDRGLGAVFDGRTYYFASRRERDVFAASPQSYAPMLGGDCPVAFAVTGERVAGRLDLGVVHNRRLVFFSTEAHREEYRRRPQDYVDVDVAAGGLCLVSYVDEGRRTPGIPETAALHGGLRYLFSSGLARREFLARPDRYLGGAATTAPRAGSMTSSSPTAGTMESPAGKGPRTDAAGRSTEGKTAASANESKDDEPKSPGEETLISSPAAIGGYCPVSIRTRGQWIRGRYDDRVELGKYLFLTAGLDERELLIASPEKYVPVLAGDCAVTMIDRGERVRGSIYHSAIYKDRLFLLAGEAEVATFKENPKRYASVDVAADGNCPVTRLDRGELVPGKVEYSAWYDGLLYRCAGATELAAFKAKPEKYAERSAETQ